MMDSAHNPEAAERALAGDPVEGEALVVTEGPHKLLEIAVQQNLDVDKLERLMELDERWRAQRAKEAYFSALAKFQAAVPSLAKDSSVDFGSTHYKYASLAVIKDAIQPALNECGLTYRWEFETADDGRITATCVITHVEGHSERTSMSAPPDTSGSKNEVQQIGSTMQYLQRYTFVGGLGITTADKDDDGRQGVAAQMPPDDPDLKPHAKTAPRFDRDAKLGFGNKYPDTPWRKVDKGYLAYLAKGTGDHALFADLELKAREGTADLIATAPKVLTDLTDLIASVHRGLEAISGSAASGILDEWLGKWALKRVEDGSEHTLGALLAILIKEYTVENPNKPETQMNLGG